MNGKRGFFLKFNGLREGDPLTLFLFVIVMEALRRLLSKVLSWFFTKASGKSLEISHSLQTAHSFSIEQINFYI